MTDVRVEWDTGPAVGMVDDLGRQASENAAGVLLARASSRVPFLTGELADSGEVVMGDDGEALVTYGTEYAAVLHSHPEWDYQGGRSGHWLEEAAEEGSDDVGQSFGDTLRSGWPG